MAAIAGYQGDIYTIDDSVSFSAAFTTESTTESGVTRRYTIDDSGKVPWDLNTAVTVDGYWAFQEFGLSTTSGADSGLTAATQYYFKLAIDGGGIVEYDITTGGGTVTWANLVSLIDTVITAAGATAEFIDGDFRIHSDDVTSSSVISLTDGTTGTSLFGSGNVPAVASLETVTWAQIAIDGYNYGERGVNYSIGVVQMTHTGLTSLTVTGAFHTLEAAGQFTTYTIAVNHEIADITEFQTGWKKNTGTLKTATSTFEHIYSDENFTELMANDLLFFKIYTNFSGSTGYSFYGVMSDSFTVTPAEVLRESLNVTISGNVDFF